MFQEGKRTRENGKRVSAEYTGTVGVFIRGLSLGITNVGFT